MYDSIINLVVALAAVLNAYAEAIDSAHPSKGWAWTDERGTLAEAAKLVVAGVGQSRCHVSLLTAEGLRNVIDDIVDPEGTCQLDFFNTDTGVVAYNLTESLFEKK